MIPVPSQVRIWLAVGRTDMRRGMQGLALQVQETLGRDPHAGDLYVFRGRSGNLTRLSGMMGSACRYMQNGSRRAGFYGRRRRTARFPYHRSPTCSTGSIGATRVTRSALSSRAEFFFEFARFSASQRTRFMIHSRAWLPPRMLFRTILAR